MSEQSPEFNIRPIIEQKTFESEAVRGFFDKWCEANDSIKPEFVDRNKWNIQKEKGILQKESNVKSTLFVPKDLQLWEMIGVIEAVDNDTFANKPEMTGKAKEKISDLGKTFEDAGVFIARRIKGITQGKEIAEALALEFYEYGQALKSGVKQETVVKIEELAQKELTPEETEKSERFLAGETLYNSRYKRAEEKSTTTGLSLEETLEEQQQHTLNQFFRVSQKAFELQEKDKNGQLQKNDNSSEPWLAHTPIHDAFIDKIQQSLTTEIESPKIELTDSVFRRGMEMLRKYMPFDKLPQEVKDNFLHWQNGEKTLREALQTDKLKTELEEAHKTGDITKISAKEREIASKIRNVISQFTKEDNAHNPSEIIANQCINCVGASTLGGAFMQEIGLNYLVGLVPEHSILFLVTSDRKVEWCDMNLNFSAELTNDSINGQKSDSTPLTTADIIEFSTKTHSEELMFNVDKNHIDFSWVKENQGQFVIISKPRYGQEAQLLSNIGRSLNGLGDMQKDPDDKTNYYLQAVEARRQAIMLSPKNSYLYNGLGYSFLNSGDYEKAIKSFQQAITINPEYLDAYLNLGEAFLKIGEHQKAMDVYQKAIKIDPENDDAYQGMLSALNPIFS